MCGSVFTQIYDIHGFDPWRQSWYRYQVQKRKLHVVTFVKFEPCQGSSAPIPIECESVYSQRMWVSVPVPLTPKNMNWLEVNKCAFTFSSEIRQIQCTRTEFWCVQCPRHAGPSALEKHQIQASALDLSYFTRKSKCKFINPIHTRQKNKIICSCSWNNINKMVLKCH